MNDTRAALPAWPLWGLLALAAASLALVGWQRQAPIPVMPAPVATEAPVSWQRALRFEDRPNGDVAVLDAQGRELTRLQGEQGFARGALRVLAHARQKRGLGPDQPFLLTALTNGRLTLSDPATGERIALESFGVTNVAVFARLRDAGLASPAAAAVAVPVPVPVSAPGKTAP
jgi:putative photosynthetic complex assembly protein